jgi:hypothetical protein
MNHRTLLLLPLLLALALPLLNIAGCAECDDGDGRCSGSVIQVCEDGEWVDETDCNEFDNGTMEVYCYVDDEGPKCGSYEKIDGGTGG